MSNITPRARKIAARITNAKTHGSLTFVKRQTGEFHCEFCGTAGKNQIVCKAGTDKTFSVGETCADKAGIVYPGAKNGVVSQFDTPKRK